MLWRFTSIKTGCVALLLSLPVQSSLFAASVENEELAIRGGDPEELPGAQTDHRDLRADTYISVYYSTTTGKWGWGRGTDFELTKAIARGYCNDNSCQFIFWTQNACAVLAVGTDFGYGWAWNADRLTAVQSALQSCSALAAGCRVVISECT